MWLGLGRLVGGEIDQAQREHSWIECVLRQRRIGSPSPLSWFSKVLLGVASKRAPPTVSGFFMRRGMVMTRS
jgi:hypothetical protein